MGYNRDLRWLRNWHGRHRYHFLIKKKITLITKKCTYELEGKRLAGVVPPTKPTNKTIVGERNAGNIV